MRKSNLATSTPLPSSRRSCARCLRSVFDAVLAATLRRCFEFRRGSLALTQGKKCGHSASICAWCQRRRRAFTRLPASWSLILSSSTRTTMQDTLPEFWWAVVFDVSRCVIFFIIIIINENKIKQMFVFRLEHIFLVLLSGTNRRKRMSLVGLGGFFFVKNTLARVSCLGWGFVADGKYGRRPVLLVCTLANVLLNSGRVLLLLLLLLLLLFLSFCFFFVFLTWRDAQRLASQWISGWRWRCVWRPGSCRQTFPLRKGMNAQAVFVLRSRSLSFVLDRFSLQLFEWFLWSRKKSFFFVLQGYFF